jgi:hypothetical protein
MFLALEERCDDSRRDGPYRADQGNDDGTVHWRILEISGQEQNVIALEPLFDISHSIFSRPMILLPAI